MKIYDLAVDNGENNLHFTSAIKINGQLVSLYSLDLSTRFKPFTYRTKPRLTIITTQNIKTFRTSK